jgi:hypothetical protein
MDTAQSIERIFAEFDRALVFVVGLLAGALVTSFVTYWRERLWFKIEAFERFRRELNETALIGGFRDANRPVLVAIVDAAFIHDQFA